MFRKGIIVMYETPSSVSFQFTSARFLSYTSLFEIAFDEIRKRENSENFTVTNIIKL